MIEVVNNGLRGNNGQFKSTTLTTTKAKLEEKYPACGIKVKPHSNYAMKRLKLVYGTIYDLLNQNGFGWDEEKKIIKVDSDEVWKEYMKSHPITKDYRYAPIPLFGKLVRSFGKYCFGGKGGAPLAYNVEEIDKE